MAPEDHEGATSLLQSFERRFLAARALPSFPWQVRMVIYKGRCGPQLKLIICSQHEAVPTEPLDALYEALAEVLMAEESTQCHRSYLLV
ncbi:Protein-lysine N-methyltransferase EEF2KMT [Lemmus lemmus]